MSEAPVIRCGEAARSQSDCLTRAGRLAAHLQRRGVQHGDRIGLLSRNSIDFLEVSIAIASAGANPVPINWHWTAPEIAHIIRDSKLRILFADDELLDRARAASALVTEGPELIAVSTAAAGVTTHEELIHGEPEPLPYQEGALPASMGLIYTSGTTGRPKGVMRERMTLEQLLAVAGATAKRMGITPGGNILVAAPLYHTSPNAVALLALRVGANITIMERFDAETFLTLVERDQIQHAKVVPTMLSRLLSLPKPLRDEFDVSSLTHLVHSAAPCPQAVKRAAIDWFGDAVKEFYGCSEAGTVTWIDAEEWRQKPGSVGRPIDGSQVEVVDDDGNRLGPDEIGHVRVTGPDYWPRFTYLNQESSLSQFPLDVGDIGYLDSDGYLFLTGRNAEVVNIGGVNVYPAEIESAALEIDAVEDAAAVARPADDDRGEQLALYVVARPGHSISRNGLVAGLAERLAPYKLPRTVEVRSSLPRDENGKIYKRLL